jgi:crotonobetainyl-CoA:carnitine CoA-transferase CaiB-like acyl-CoA transferase
MQHLFTPPPGAPGSPDSPAKDQWPPKVRPAFGDMAGALAVAGAVSAALFRRLSTGQPSVIDVALLASGLWQIAPDITNAGIGDTHDAAAQPDRHSFWNPLWLTYRTRDGRFISFMMLHGDPHWPDLCARLGQPALGSDERFTTGSARQANSRECVEALDALFAAHDYAWFLRALDGFAGEWAPVQTPAELHSDPQVKANGFIADTDMGNGVSLPLVTSPAQFDERPGTPSRAPEAGEHTESVLLELGMSWEEITALKDDGAIT